MKLKNYYQNQIILDFQLLKEINIEKKAGQYINLFHLANKSLIKNKIPVFFIEKNQEQIIEKIKNQVPGALFPELNLNYLVLL